jgi:SAM-dependent methyltransferase
MKPGVSPRAPRAEGDECERPARIGPTAYASWRATPLGAITERLEQRLILGIAGDVAGRRVLDIGCGDGVLACALAARGARVLGVDADLDMLAAARQRAANLCPDAEFTEARAERLPFPDASFDVVVAVTVLCFVSDADAAVREMIRVLRPGGRLVIGELGRWNTWAAVRRVQGWRGSSIWRTARFRTAGELRRLARQAGMRDVNVRGSVYYPPSAALARRFARADALLGHRTTIGAAFLALSGVKRG